MNGPLAEVLRYNRWANLRLFEACRGMTEEQIAWRLPAASGSVGELLIHIVGGQQTFALRTMGRQHEGEYNRSSPWPGFEPLFAALSRSNDELVHVAERLDTDRDVDLPWMGKVYRFPVSFFLVHAAEHGTTHRTEVTVTLNYFGVETPDLDAWSYAPERGFGQEVPPG